MAKGFAKGLVTGVAGTVAADQVVCLSQQSDGL